MTRFALPVLLIIVFGSIAFTGILFCGCESVYRQFRKAAKARSLLHRDTLRRCTGYSLLKPITTNYLIKTRSRYPIA